MSEYIAAIQFYHFCCWSKTQLNISSVGGKQCDLNPNCLHQNVSLTKKLAWHQEKETFEQRRTCKSENTIKVKQAGAEVKKCFSCSTKLSTKFIMLINVKMPTIVGILIFISMINTTSERLQTINFFICRYFSFYEQLTFRAQLS